MNKIGKVQISQTDRKILIHDLIMDITNPIMLKIVRLIYTIQLHEEANSDSQHIDSKAKTKARIRSKTRRIERKRIRRKRVSLKLPNIVTIQSKKCQCLLITTTTELIEKINHDKPSASIINLFLKDINSRAKSIIQLTDNYLMGKILIRKC